MRIGVISDTHGLVRPEALEALRGVEAILHAGDIGGREVLEALSAIAPVHAIRGNNDTGRWGRALPDALDVELAGKRFHLIHDLKELGPRGEWDAVVCGHSHKPKIAWDDGLLVLNPGSAGPRRFSLPIGVARVRIARGKLEPELIQLTVR